jgi:hypothetical protein
MIKIRIDQILLSSVLGASITAIFGIYADITELYGSGGIWLSGLISAFIIFFCMYNIASIIYEKIKRFLYFIFFLISIISGLILFVFLSWGVNLMKTADLNEMSLDDLIVILMISIIISLTTQMILFSTGTNETVPENNTSSFRFILISSIVFGIILAAVFFGIIIQGLAIVSPIDNDRFNYVMISLIIVPLVIGFIYSFLILWMSIRAFRSFPGRIIYFVHNGFIFGFIIWFIFEIIIHPEGMLYELQEKINHGLVSGIIVSSINGIIGYCWNSYINAKTEQQEITK